MIGSTKGLSNDFNFATSALFVASGRLPVAERLPVANRFVPSYGTKEARTSPGPVSEMWRRLIHIPLNGSGVTGLGLMIIVLCVREVRC